MPVDALNPRTALHSPDLGASGSPRKPGPAADGMVIRRTAARRATLCCVGLALMLASGSSRPALADGGAGGADVYGDAPSAGGAAYGGAAGGNGTSTYTFSGYGTGGGGGGAGGGKGGDGYGSPGSGGLGGTVGSPNGHNGGDAAGQGGGGGGGGGYNGNGAGVSTLGNASPLIGGAGGGGGHELPGAAGGLNGGGGGGGGAGGYGAVVTGAGASSNGSSIGGGAGGAGGYGNQGGSGGDGGVGVYFSSTGASFTNSSSGSLTGGTGGVGGFGGFPGGSAGGIAGNGGNGGAGVSLSGGMITNAGTIAGGNGGAGGISGFASVYNGSFGAGGAGIIGSGLVIIDSGSISGGLSGNGVTGANAITFTGGANRLTLESGWSLIGNIGLGVGATLTFNQANIDATVANIITGSGAIKVDDGGSGHILTLSGANSYTGGTTVTRGALVVQNSASLGSGVLALWNGTTLILDGNGLNLTNNITVAGDPTFTVNAGNTNTISGNIADGGTPGDVVKNGGGTLIFSGNNTYTGSTTVNQGVLRAGSTSAFGLNSATTVAGGATVDLGGFDNSIGSLAGAGSVTNSGGADAVLTTGGDNTSATFSGVISDGATNKAGLTKTGTGAFTLSGGNTYTGSTRIDAGTLIVDGSIASSSMTTVNSGATLSGVGTVGSLTVASGGLFAPGSGAAGSSMSVAGNLLFGSGAIYQTMVSTTTASFATVTGSVTLTGANVAGIYAPGSYLSRQYTVLHATGGFGGTSFSGLVSTSLPAGFHETLSYGANDVYLNLIANLGAINGDPSFGLPRNPQNVASGLNNWFNAGGALPPNFVNVFGLTGPALLSTLSSLSGESATAAPQSAFGAMNRFLDAMLDPSLAGREGEEASSSSLKPLAFAPDRPNPLPQDVALAYASVLKPEAAKTPYVYEPRFTSWATSFGGYSNLAGDPNGAGSHTVSGSLFGVAAGLDYRLAPETVIGAALAGGGTNWGLSQGLGGGNSDFLQAGVYGSTHFGPAYVSGAFGFANHWTATQRTAAFGDALSASFSAQNYAGRLEGGYRLATPFGGVTPYAAVQEQAFVLPGFTESDQLGGGFALNYAGRSFTDARAEAGARFDQAVGVFGGATLALKGRAAYAHDWVSDPTLATAFNLLPGASFIAEGAKPLRNAAAVSAGPELRLRGGATLFAKFDGEFSARGQTYLGSAGLRYAW